MKYNRRKSKLNNHHQLVANAIKLYLDADSYEEFQLNRDLDNIPASVGRYYGLNTFSFIKRLRTFTGSRCAVEGCLNICFFTSMILMYVSAIILIAITNNFWLIGIYFLIGYIICDFLRKICNLDNTIRHFECTRNINDYYDNFKSSMTHNARCVNISATITTNGNTTTITTNNNPPVNKTKIEKSKVSFDDILEYIEQFKWHI